MAVIREFILFLACDRKFRDHDILCDLTHETACQRADKSVCMKNVFGLFLAHSHAPAGIPEYVGSVGRAFHSSCQYRVGISQAHPVSCKHYRAQPGTAADIYRERRNRLIYPRLEHGIPRRVCSDACLPAISHNYFFDRISGCA